MTDSTRESEVGPNDDDAPIEGSPFSPRLTHRLMLEFGDRKDFDDPRLEWRRLFSELLGTFFLVLVAAGGGILVGEGQISLAAAVVAPGLMVMAIILFMGAISGAHLNPAVSLAFALRGRGGDPIARAAGSGVLSPGRLEEKQRLSGQIDRGEVVPPGFAEADEADRQL